MLTIIGLTLALVAPRFAAARDRAAVRAAVGEVGAIVASARQTAIARRTLVAIVFDPSGGWIEVRTHGQPLARRSLHAVYGVRFTANRDSAVYDPRGLGYGAANLTMTVRRGSVVDTLTMSRLGRLRW